MESRRVPLSDFYIIGISVMGGCLSTGRYWYFRWHSCVALNPQLNNYDTLGNRTTQIVELINMKGVKISWNLSKRKFKCYFKPLKVKLNLCFVSSVVVQIKSRSRAWRRFLVWRHRFHTYASKCLYIYWKTFLNCSWVEWPENDTALKNKTGSPNTVICFSSF